MNKTFLLYLDEISLEHVRKDKQCYIPAFCKTRIMENVLNNKMVLADYSLSTLCRGGLISQKDNELINGIKNT